DVVSEFAADRGEERFGFLAGVAVGDRSREDLLIGGGVGVADAGRDHHACHPTSRRIASIASRIGPKLSGVHCLFDVSTCPLSSACCSPSSIARSFDSMAMYWAYARAQS